MFFRSKLWLTISLILLGSVLVPASLSAQPQDSAYNPNELSYGLYWFGPNNANQKFVHGESNPYFDPGKPTLIFVHGWQPFLSYELPTFDFNGTDTAVAWINAGWNVGIFVWNQFSDETTGVLLGESWFANAPPPQGVTDAEAKIWTPDGPKGMRWRDWDDLPPFGDGYSDAPAGTPSAAELFYNAYVAAMTEHDYTGGNIRIAGHSLGNQMAVRLTKLVSDGIAAGNVPEKLRPTRVALLDPYWSPDGKSYLGGKTTGEMVREYVAGLLPAGTLFEWYHSSDWTTEPQGDSNEALKPMMLYATMEPTFALDDMNRHLAAQHLYFWSYAFDGPGACTGNGCLGMTRLLSKMSDSQLAAVMRSDYRWTQNGGQSSATPQDDTYQPELRAHAPYTITQLLAVPGVQTVGRAVTITATVEDKNNAPAGEGTLVTFGTDLGEISTRSAVSDGLASAQVTSAVPGVAHVTATTKGSGGTIQNVATVTFTGYVVLLPLVLRH